MLDVRGRRVGPLRPLGGLLASLVAASALASACGGGGSSPTLPSSDSGVAIDGGLAPLESAPPVTIATASRLDAASSTVVFDRLRGGVWTANGDVGTVTSADVIHGKVLQEIAVGQEVTSVALSPDFTWLAAVDHTGATVSLIDATSGQVRRAIALGTHPRAAVWDASDPRWLYVSLEDDGAIAIVDRTL